MPNTITVLFFAQARELVGSKELQWEVKEGTLVCELVDQIVQKHSSLKQILSSLLLSHNLKYVALDCKEVLRPKDEIAFIPPLAGG